MSPTVYPTDEPTPIPTRYIQQTTPNEEVPSTTTAAPTRRSEEVQSSESIIETIIEYLNDNTVIWIIVGTVSFLICCALTIKNLKNPKVTKVMMMTMMMMMKTNL